MHDFPAVSVWHEHRISYGETDAMGVLYYAEYLHIFERARGTYIRTRGMSYVEVERRGVFLPVREAACRYKSPSRYDEVILVRAGISECGRASLRFLYEVWNEDKSSLRATGTTQHAVVDSAGKPVPLPAWLKAISEA